MDENPGENATALKFLILGSFKYKSQGIFWELRISWSKMSENTVYYLCIEGMETHSSILA